MSGTSWYGMPTGRFVLLTWRRRTTAQKAVIGVVAAAGLATLAATWPSPPAGPLIARIAWETGTWSDLVLWLAAGWLVLGLRRVQEWVLDEGQGSRTDL